ncbi:protein NRT1/ PTR FAMILY 4.6-like isoform X2 [Silene latifolia]|uniref:protein NRT1/ PTR FAMILY 4.6-like isoform X2 n=1 Tax=Silene latifolia TaxID=37657 RepID=UPI003D787C3A
MTEGDETQRLSKWEGYVDWRNRPALRGRHGGVLAAFFVLVVEVLENLAYLANASNLVLYLSKYMHFSPSRSAIMVTNFMGTAFLLALLGGFFSDAFFTTYHIFCISAVIEFMGLLILTIQAQKPSLQPSPCSPNITNNVCDEVPGVKAAVLFTGLYLVALGVGGIKGSLPPHGANQFDENSTDGRKRRSSFFNYYVFCLSCGALIAVTFVVWIEDNVGWQWGFGVSTLTILLSVPVFLLGSFSYRIKVPAGSPITTIFKVLMAAICKKFFPKKRSNAIRSMGTSPPSVPDDAPQTNATSRETNSMNPLNKAMTSNPTIHQQLECTPNQVEDVKIVIKTIPIFASTIMLNSCLAQLSTFSVQQAASMNTELGSLKVPPASLPVFPVIFIMVLAPVYDHIVLPFARRVTQSEMGITHLQRIGTGLFMSIVAMAVAALVEIKRKTVAAHHNLLNSTEPLPITFLWIAIQYLFLGSADLFSLAGLLEFFYTEAPTSMRSLATSFSWASLAVGYYLSSVLVSVVNRVTGLSGHNPWLMGSNLNHYQLDRFYWLMCVLSGLNFLNYLFWARRYNYRSVNQGY